MGAITQGFQSLIAYFQEPKEKMRIYTNPTTTSTSEVQNKRLKQIDELFGFADRPTVPMLPAVSSQGSPNYPIGSDPKSNFGSPGYQTGDYRKIPSMLDGDRPDKYSNSSIYKPTPSEIKNINDGKSPTSKETVAPSKPATSSPPKKKINLKAVEKFSFHKINDASIVSLSSPTGIYSEVSVVLWLKRTNSSSYGSHGYSGSSNWGATERRLVISSMFDSENNLWSISCKLLKREGYSKKDDEEVVITNRLCAAPEVISEIKKMLLYIGISPRQAYMLFRRTINRRMIKNEAIEGFSTYESANHSPLLEKLNKSDYSYGSSSSSSSSSSHDKKYDDDRYSEWMDSHEYPRSNAHHSHSDKRSNAKLYR